MLIVQDFAVATRNWNPEITEDQAAGVHDEELDLAVAKCTGGGMVIPKKPWPSASSLAAVEALGDAETALAEVNVASDLVGRKAVGMEEADFVDSECDEQEMAAFKTRFGLNGVVDLGSASFSDREVCGQNNVVWLYPAGDNLAFGINPNVCHRLSVWSETACSVQVRRVSSVGEAAGYLSSLPESSILHLVLGGHGTGRALRWGPDHHLFGVLESDHPFAPVGRVVSLKRDVTGANGAIIFAGTPCYVHGVDSDGDVVIFFSGDRVDWVRKEDLDGVKVEDDPGSKLLAEVNARMQRHASLFLDSCKSADPSQSQNLAQFMAKTVGKGVRVIGSVVSFGKVDVTRFGAWHASIDTSEVKGAQRVFLNEEARCPDFAWKPMPDENGDCACKLRMLCVTSSRERCPNTRGKEGPKYFLPFCAEGYVKDRCICVPMDDKGNPVLPAGS